MFRIVSILIYFNTHAFKKSQYFHGIYSMVDFADFYNNSTDFNVKKISYRFWPSLFKRIKYQIDSRPIDIVQGSNYNDFV